MTLGPIFCFQNKQKHFLVFNLIDLDLVPTHGLSIHFFIFLSSSQGLQSRPSSFIDMLLQTKKSEVIFVITLNHLLYILVELNMQENTKKFEVRLNSTNVDKLFFMNFFI